MTRPKAKPLFVRLSPEERRILESAAHNAGLSHAEFVRLMLRGLLTPREREVAA